MPPLRRVRASGVTEADGSLRFDAQGNLSVSGLRQLVANPAWDYLGGESPVALVLRVRGGLLDLTADSSLAGVTSSLPAPFAKESGEGIAAAHILDHIRPVQIARQRRGIGTQGKKYPSRSPQLRFEFPGGTGSGQKLAHLLKGELLGHDRGNEEPHLPSLIRKDDGMNAIFPERGRDVQQVLPAFGHGQPQPLEDIAIIEHPVLQMDAQRQKPDRIAFTNLLVDLGDQFVGKRPLTDPVREKPEQFLFEQILGLVATQPEQAAGGNTQRQTLGELFPDPKEIRRDPALAPVDTAGPDRLTQRAQGIGLFAGGPEMQKLEPRPDLVGAGRGRQQGVASQRRRQRGDQQPAPARSCPQDVQNRPHEVDHVNGCLATLSIPASPAVPIKQLRFILRHLFMRCC